MDVSNAMEAKTQLQVAADGAALAGASAFKGTNKQQAIDAAEAHLARVTSSLPVTASFNVSMDEAIKVEVTSLTNSSLINVAGMPGFKVAVASQAVPAQKISTVKFTPTQSSGRAYKETSIFVRRPNSNLVETVGKVIYQPVTTLNDGNGYMVVGPKPSLELGEYTDIFLRMDVKRDGCPLYYAVEIIGTDILCRPSNAAKETKFDRVLGTDDPQKSHHLFVNGVQLPQGKISPLLDVLECGTTVNHAWEDGGGWNRQDMFYKIEAECEYVAGRLAN